MQKNQPLPIRDLCGMGVFVAVITVTAQIIVPMPLGVPITMQTFAICLAGILLGPRKGALAALAYLLLGAVGAPVFSGFHGGLHRLIGPTGGFLLSYPIMVWLIGRGAKSDSRGGLALSMGLAICVNYTMGTLIYSLVSGGGLWHAFTACVLPFIPTDIAKSAAAAAVGGKIRARLSFPAA